MRSLDEVRADLARLRESAKERHAANATTRRRDNSFAATDFLDFGAPAPKPADNPESSFAPTAFLDFTVIKPATDG